MLQDAYRDTRPLQKVNACSVTSYPSPSSSDAATVSTECCEVDKNNLSSCPYCGSVSDDKGSILNPDYVKLLRERTALSSGERYDPAKDEALQRYLSGQRRTTGNLHRDRNNRERQVRALLGKRPKCVTCKKLRFNYFTRYYVVTYDKDSRGTAVVNVEYCQEGNTYCCVSQIFESRQEAEACAGGAQKLLLWYFQNYTATMKFDDKLGIFILDK